MWAEREPHRRQRRGGEEMSDLPEGLFLLLREILQKMGACAYPSAVNCELRERFERALWSST